MASCHRPRPAHAGLGSPNILRLWQVLSDSCAVVATGGGCVWSVASGVVGQAEGEPGPPSATLLLTEPGRRWNALACRRQLLLVGSACGAARLVSLPLRAAAAACRGADGSAAPGVHAAEGAGAGVSCGSSATVVAAWQAHATCVLHAEFVVEGAVSSCPSGLLLVTACPAAELRVWRVQGDDGAARLIRRMQLVPRPQRMAALRCSCPQGGAVPWLLCGGSAGALAACRLSADAEAEAGDETPLLSPTSSLPHAHAEQAVTDALARRVAAAGVGPDEATGECEVCVYSCGRNGTVNEYAAAVTGPAPRPGDPCAVELRALRSWRCPGANFLERLLPCSDGDFVVMAFLQSEMMLWKLQARQQLYRVRCHGYRHPKHLLWSEDDAGGEPRFHFGYATGSCLHRHGSPPQVATAATTTAATPSAPRSLTPSLHGREVLAALALPYALHAGAPLGAARKAECLFATGSEDNEVRILSCEADEAGGAPDVLQPPRCLATLQGHPAAVRALALSCPEDCAQPAVLFSAGGKEVIHCWHLPRQTTSTSNASAEQHELRPSLICARVLPERNAAKALGTLRTEAEADARYLSAAALHLPSGRLAVEAAAEGEPPSAHLLAAGTSNAHIELHVLGSRRRALLPVARLASEGGLVLCLALQQTQKAAGVTDEAAHADEVLLVSGDTSGTVAVWRLRPLLASGVPSLAVEMVRRAGAAIPPAMSELQPSCRVALHAMGVNCLCVAWLPGSGGGDGTLQLAVVTGGDDQALGACLLNIPAAGGTDDDVVLLYGGLLHGAHGASIRGLACTHGAACVFSSGPDQRLKGWEIDWPAIARQPQGRAVRRLDGAGGVGQAPEILLRLASERAVATSHTYALCAREWGKAGGDQAVVVAAGHGVQAVVVSGLMQACAVPKDAKD